MATEIEQNIQRDERTTFPYKIVFVHEFLLNMPSVGIPIHIKRLTYGKRMTCGSWGGGSASDTIKKRERKGEKRLVRLVAVYMCFRSLHTV